MLSSIGKCCLTYEALCALRGLGGPGCDGQPLHLQRLGDLLTRCMLTVCFLEYALAKLQLFDNVLFDLCCYSRKCFEPCSSLPVWHCLMGLDQILFCLSQDLAERHGSVVAFMRAVARSNPDSGITLERLINTILVRFAG